jgi:hypothetical protein
MREIRVVDVPPSPRRKVLFSLGSFCITTFLPHQNQKRKIYSAFLEFLLYFIGHTFHYPGVLKWNEADDDDDDDNDNNNNSKRRRLRRTEFDSSTSNMTLKPALLYIRRARSNFSSSLCVRKSKRYSPSSGAKFSVTLMLRFPFFWDVAWRFIPQERKPQLHCCESLIILILANLKNTFKSTYLCFVRV